MNFWDNLTRQREQIKAQISSLTANISGLEKQRDITITHVEELYKTAQECKVRVKVKKA